MQETAIDLVFVYGTLIEGEERWHHLEPFVVGTQIATTPGLLFDTHLGYPAARFDATASIAARIHGVLLTLDRDVLDDCLAMLDEVESAETGLYRRIVVETDEGEAAWAYQYGHGIDVLTPIPSGSWLHHNGGPPPEAAHLNQPLDAGSAATPAPPPSPDGLGILSFVESRIIGALIEKAMATPQNYPLSLTALAAACNQRSSRDPVTSLEESEVEEVLATGKERKLVRYVHPRSGHGVTKFRHVLDEHLDLDEPETALLGVLLLRGAQTARELRDRTDRLHSFEDTNQTELTLARLAHRGFVVRLDRAPGQRDERWVHLLG